MQMAAVVLHDIISTAAGPHCWKAKRRVFNQVDFNGRLINMMKVNWAGLVLGLCQLLVG